MQRQEFVETIRQRAVPIREPKDLSTLIDQLGNKRVVMLGEATHGTHEFYDWRRIISEWLIVKHGFDFIAVEGDWPPCWELNRHITGDAKGSVRESLENFNRWPTWMWANTDVIRLADWMRTRNVAAQKPVSFYGLDVYSLFESIDAVLRSLEDINPFLARRARVRYACFEPYRHDEKAYARSLIDLPEGCAEEVISNLTDILNLRLFGSMRSGVLDIQQNAQVVAHAERYYRSMIHADEDSWNIRDRHMLDTLERLLEHHGPDSKGIVWAHNTHIGDYKATEMARQGLINIGGLAREKWGEHQVGLVGFGTYEGKVTASHAWDGPVETMNLPPARAGSCEAAFHEASLSLKAPVFHLNLRGARSGPLAETLGHRAVGVVYHPAHERLGNYVPTSLAHRYDAFIHVDRTSALEPLIQGFAQDEIPETWPQGM